MSLYAPVASRQEIDGNGRPYAGGLIYTYESGTTTPKVTYDADGNVQSNPIVLDSEGRYSIKLGGGLYSMTMTDGMGATVFDSAVVEGVVVWTKNAIGYSDTIGTFTTVTNMAALRTLPAASSSFVVMKGYNVVGDQGAGTFYWDTNNSSSDDSGIIIKPTGYTGIGRWHRQFTGNVSPRWFGAKADGTDDSPAFVKALIYCRDNIVALDLQNGTYTLSSDPGFTQSIKIIMSDAVLAWNGFAPSINPLIPVSDTNRHFNSATNPVFASDTSGKYAEIKNVWLDGITPGWYQSSIMNDTSAQITQVNTSLRTDTSARFEIDEAKVTLLNQLVYNYIRGLDTVLETSTSKVTMNPGMCNTTDGTKLYTTVAGSAIQKDLDKIWAEGNTNGGRPSSVTMSVHTWYHMFLLGKKTDSSAFEMGFDTNINATNLLADATNFSTYRRIGSVLNSSNLSIAPYLQIGNDFFIQNYFQTMLRTSASSYTQTVKLSPGASSTTCPPDVRTKLNIGTLCMTVTGAKALCEINEVGSPSHGYAVNNGGAGGNGLSQFLPVFVWSDTSQQISATYGVSSGGGSIDVFLRVDGWTDPRGTI